MTLRTPFAAYGWFTAVLASRLALRATASGGFGDDNGVGFASACSRAARLGVLPTTASSPGGTRSDQIADHRQSSGETDAHLRPLA